tara:strand:+ start:112 stop:441 length:330 start_codon:yes stop_codon:yes gene_type:complete
MTDKKKYDIIDEKKQETIEIVSSSSFSRAAKKYVKSILPDNFKKGKKTYTIHIMLNNNNSKTNIVKVYEVQVEKFATPIEKEINDKDIKRVIRIGSDINSKWLRSYKLG